MGKRKYRAGIMIQSVAEFESCESQWFIWNGRTRRRSALEHEQYKTLAQFIYCGRLYTAERTDDE